MILRAGALAVVAVVLAACGANGGSSRTAWPSTYRTMVCAAIGYLDEANSQIGDIADASEAFDLVGLAQSARQMEARAEDAQESIKLAPVWQPGSQLANHVAAAALSYRRSANLLATGVEEFAADVIVRGVSEAQAGADSLESAAAAAEVLAEEYGWERC